MQAVPHAAHFGVGVVLLAAHTGIHIQGNPSQAAYFIRHADGFLGHFRRKSVAVFPAALTPEFRTSEVLDIGPERPRLGVFHFGRRVHSPGRNCRQKGGLGLLAWVSVRFQPFRRLKKHHGLPGLASGDPVRCAHRIAKVQ